MSAALVVLTLQLLAVAGAATGDGTAQAVDPALQNDVVRLLEVTGAGRVVEQMLAIVTNQMIEMLRQGQNDIPQRAVDIMKEVIAAKATAGIPTLLQQMVPVYTKHFTHDEVRALLAFYASDVGKKAAALAPTMMQEGVRIGDEWGKNLMPELQSELERRLRAEGLIK